MLEIDIFEENKKILKIGDSELRLVMPSELKRDTWDALFQILKFQWISILIRDSKYKVIKDLSIFFLGGQICTQAYPWSGYGSVVNEGAESKWAP